MAPPELAALTPDLLAHILGLLDPQTRQGAVPLADAHDADRQPPQRNTMAEIVRGRGRRLRQKWAWRPPRDRWPREGRDHPRDVAKATGERAGLGHQSGIQYLIPTAPSSDSHSGGPGACVLLDTLCC